MHEISCTIEKENPTGHEIETYCYVIKPPFE